MRLAVRQYQHMINDLCETAQTDTATIHRLEAELREAQALIGRLEVDLAYARHQLRGNLHTATDAQVPEFVLVGIDRGNGQGKRLIAARDLPGAALAMTDMDDPPPRWKVTATLARPLFIDRPSYAAALEHMRTIWANWDADQPTTAIGP
jgi:hypothetical protein